VLLREALTGRRPSAMAAALERDPDCPACTPPATSSGVAAPSGAGKSSLVKALLELDSHAGGVGLPHHRARRAARSSSGAEYRFVDAGTHFQRHGRRAASFLEWAQAHGNLYGTSRARPSRTACRRGEDVVLEIDWQGALQIKQLFPDAVLIFILPPSWEELLPAPATPRRGPRPR
jgi:guanylate kinase